MPKIMEIIARETRGTCAKMRKTQEKGIYMNILITINENFLFPAKVMLYSLAKYHRDLEGKYAAFVKDRYDFCDEVVAQKKKLGLSDEDTYFNSGVILFDLKVFRENIKLEAILEFIRENKEALRFFDQDTFNVLLRKHKKLCEEWYNFQV